MTKIPFYKYQGTGNDFVLVDQRDQIFLTKNDVAEIQQICDRRFGIGADGLILLQEKAGYDFEMIYFNADGRESTMCGNGGRCITAFASYLGIIEDKCRFWAIDGEHEALVKTKGWVELKMGNVKEIEHGEDYFVLDTGSPHYVVFVEDLKDINVVDTGQAIRYSDRFRKEGINVNFVEKSAGMINVATYERGVEDETLSCGTGVTAAAISYALLQDSPSKSITEVETKGGRLQVKLEKSSTGFRDVWLCGPTAQVFNGAYIMTC